MFHEFFPAVRNISDKLPNIFMKKRRPQRQCHITKKKDQNFVVRKVSDREVVTVFLSQSTFRLWSFGAVPWLWEL